MEISEQLNEIIDNTKSLALELDKDRTTVAKMLRRYF